MRILKWIHHLHAFLILLLLVSGFCLYFSPARTWFNEVHFPLVSFHILAACVYTAVMLLSLYRVIRYVFHKPYLKKFNVFLNVAFFSVWFVTGLLMYFQAHVPVTVRNLAVDIHGWCSFLILPWIAAHSLGHFLQWRIPWPNWWRGKAPLPPVLEENRLERRDFVKFLSFGALFVLIGGVLRWLSPILAVASEENKRRGHFRIYNVTNDFPRYEQEEWTLKIDGLVDRPLTLTMEDMQRVPWITIVDDFHCVTGWSVRGVEMRGIKMKTLFAEYDIKPRGEFVTVYSGDGVYYDSFITSQLLEEEAMLVFHFDGEALKKSQGFPCRLYHPDMYGYKSVKWVERLEFTQDRQIGYWQQRGGYDLNGYL